MNEGVLYVVATPIGNLQDITARALDTLKRVARIAAEDTRHSRKLLAHYGIDTPMTALHEHNEHEVTGTLLKMLHSGTDLALISDAGTPLISDPGFYLVRAVRQAGMKVVPVPGPSACITALSASGLPTDRFVFEGFLPAREHARRQRLEALRDEHRTLVFYESSHRVADCLTDMVEVLGAGRAAVVARELTKTFETIRAGALSELLAWLLGDAQQQRGEFVVMVQGEAPAAEAAMDPQAQQVLELLMQELPLKQAAALASKITGLAKNLCYQRALELKKAN
ncbi:MAG: 16S rRNA (cytidine(1402)-2'-O)-methyltransferase [Gammaproteobacteria bacterium]|nr:16S rRNA (cytidine(1402)-2'-O)-methyltransferase [Gammaproteobacteria bacterium]